MNFPDFMDKAKGLTKNPLGIIALFISLIYGFACLVLSTSIINLHGSAERLPLIYFIIIFPILILGVFTFLVIKHHEKLYAPSDFIDEDNFIKVLSGNKEIASDINKVNEKLKSIVEEQGKPENSSKQDITELLGELSKELEKIKEASEVIDIPINDLWNLNHWGNNYASIVNDTMVFEGSTGAEDGSHIDLIDFLELGKTYGVSCFAKSDPNTTGKFRLWCHNNIGDVGITEATPFKTPSVDGELIKLPFKAEINTNFRIHFQYIPGKGKIVIKDLKVRKLN